MPEILCTRIRSVKAVRPPPPNLARYEIRLPGTRKRTGRDAPPAHADDPENTSSVGSHIQFVLMSPMQQMPSNPIASVVTRSSRHAAEGTYPHGSDFDVLR
jgi:hypothetical protein